LGEAFINYLIHLSDLEKSPREEARKWQKREIGRSKGFKSRSDPPVKSVFPEKPSKAFFNILRDSGSRTLIIPSIFPESSPIVVL